MRITNLAKEKMSVSGGNGKGLEGDGYSLFEGTSGFSLGSKASPPLPPKKRTLLMTTVDSTEIQNGYLLNGNLSLQI